MILSQFLPEKNWFMRLRVKYLIVIFILVLPVLLAGCQKDRAAHVLWPELDDPYVKVTREWTRAGSVHSGIETDIIAQATLKSGPWQKAYVQKRARIYSLTEAEQEELSQRLSSSLENETEIFLSLYSPKTEQARIKPENSLWSIFIQDQDQKIYPVEIRPARQPLAVLQTFYPYVRKGRQNYTLTFPVAARDSLLMIMTGPLGRIEFRW